ncbi:MAG: hypothetical protein WAT79_11850 [Saprospiraceae bacterium]
MKKINILPPISLLFLLFIFTSSRCSVQPKLHDKSSSTPIFLDSTQASIQIIAADVEGFFDHITSLDMSIQMQSKTQNSTREKVLVQFKKFLATQVSPWESSEIELLIYSLKEAKKMVEKVNEKAWPPISLVKIKTNHYGKHVYYTRGNIIFIPENIFENYVHEEQIPVLIHEIFHILSKNHMPLRDSLYQLIGFKKLSSVPVIKGPLAENLLTNPDGVTRQYALEINDEHQTTLVIPLISSKFSAWKKETPHFFDYLSFDLYPIQWDNGKYVVQTNEWGHTTMPLKQTQQFFTKIKDNTQYIIHPEEIIADNFMLAVLYNHDNQKNKFSEEGKKLIDNVLQMIRFYHFKS